MSLSNNLRAKKSKKMKLFFIPMLLGIIFPRTDVGAQANQPVMLENPVTVQYLKTNLSNTTPRLVLTPAIEKTLKAKLQSDPVVKNYYAAMKLSAKDILARPVLTYNVIGRRLLGTSREMLSRMTTCGNVTGCRNSS